MIRFKLILILVILIFLIGICIPRKNVHNENASEIELVDSVNVINQCDK